MARGRKPQSGKYYINNKEFLAVIIESLEQDDLTPRAIELFMLLAERIAHGGMFYYSNEDDRDTCQSGALEDLLRYWKGFNPEKSDNPFAYYTRVVINGMQKTFNKLYPIPKSRMLNITGNNIYSF